MNDIIAAIVDHIDSNLSYKFQRINWQYGTISFDHITQKKDIKEAIANNTIESAILCGQLFNFIMRDNSIIVYYSSSRPSSWHQSPAEVTECYKFNLCDNTKDGIDVITAMLMLQELKHLPHSQDDKVLDRLLDAMCLADKRLQRNDSEIILRDTAITFKPKLIYPRQKNVSSSVDNRRLLCIEYYSKYPQHRSSITYDFDDVRCFKKIIKWLAKDKFLNHIDSHMSKRTSR